MKFKKSENLHFSKEVNPWFWSKNGHFSNFFFLGNIGQEKFFSIFLNKKMPFQAIKTRSSKSRITDNFPRGLTHGFGQKMAIFPTFFYSIQARKSSFRIFQHEKKPFLGYENKKLKKSENRHFSKGVNPWFWSGNSHFSNFFFRQFSQGKCLLRYSGTKKRLSRL